jgi:hypothetical protein
MSFLKDEPRCWHVVRQTSHGMSASLFKSLPSTAENWDSADGRARLCQLPISQPELDGAETCVISRTWNRTSCPDKTRRGCGTLQSGHGSGHRGRIRGDSAMRCEPARLRISPPITPSWRDSGQRALRRCESRHLPRQNGAIAGTAPDGGLDVRAKGVSGNESGNGCRILGTAPSAGTATFRLGCA